MKRIADAGIRISNVQKAGNATIRFSIPAKRFFALRKLRKGLPLRIRIVRRGGLPFQIRKLRSRPVLWIGSCALFLIIAILSSRIWIIRIDETKRVEPAEIKEQLEAHDIRPGTYLKGPILITAANDLSAQIHDAAWIGLDREGVLLHVKVVEALEASEKPSNAVPSDVIALKDGVVTSIQVMRGQARVKVGNTVKAGDVLISGDMLYKDAVYETAADGTVLAAVRYRAESEVVDRITESYETGAAETVRVLRIWNRELMRSKPVFEHYRITTTDSIVKSALMPFAVETQTAYEIAFRERILTQEEAEENALVSAREQAYALVPQNAAIINTYGTIRTRDGKRYAVVIVTAEETIGKTEERPHDG